MLTQKTSGEDQVGRYITLLIVVTAYITKSNLRKGGIVWARSSRMQSILAEI